jgi:hypothetical protein
MHLPRHLSVDCSNTYRSLISLEDYDEEKELNLNDPLDNPDGIVIVKGNNIVVDDEEFDSFVLLYPTWGDVREVTDEQFGMKASISRDGSAILVTKPRFPYFFRDSIVDMWAQEDKPYQQIINAHKILANSIQKRAASAYMKTICYRLKSGIKIKGGPFNGGDGLELSTELRFVPLEVGEVDGTVIQNQIPYAYWHICLDMPSRVITKKKTTINANLKLTRMLESVSITGYVTRTAPADMDDGA